MSEDADILMSDTDEEAITLHDVVEYFHKAWQNEKVSPTLLPTQGEYLALLIKHVETEESELEQMRPNDPQVHIRKLMVERLKFVICDYLRVRLKKIENYAQFILEKERNREPNFPTILTSDEYRFARSFSQSVKEYLENACTSRMPANLRTLESHMLSMRPNESAYVFFKACRDIGNLTVEENNESVLMNVKAGEQHFMRFDLIADLLHENAIELL